MQEPTPYEIGILAGVSTSDILRPPAEWELYIAPYRWARGIDVVAVAVRHLWHGQNVMEDGIREPAADLHWGVSVRAGSGRGPGSLRLVGVGTWVGACGKKQNGPRT